MLWENRSNISILLTRLILHGYVICFLITKLCLDILWSIFKPFYKFVWNIIITILGNKRQQNQEKNKKIAVIGGGIAGSGCAWVLEKSGFQVTLFEQNATLGGNAKVQSWSECENIISGLSVLAWPKDYFHNYKQLLCDFQIESQEVKLPFSVENAQKNVNFIQDNKNTTGWSYFYKDIERWNNVVDVVRRVNKLQAKVNYKSLYSISQLNPFNFIPIRFLAWIHGVSQEFWDTIVVSIYTSSFLSKDMEYYPSAILPTLDDLISIDKIPVMESWKENSTHVFNKLTQRVKVMLNKQIQIVQETKNKTFSLFEINGSIYKDFDYVIFASSSYSVHKCLSQEIQYWKRLLNCLLRNIEYSDETDVSFREGIIHSDDKILPENIRASLLKNNSNHVRLSYDKNKQKIYENTFILSSWLPIANRPDIVDKKIPMLVTYNNQSKIDETKIIRKIQNYRAHPHLSFKNLLIQKILGLFQGRSNFYYCGAYMTPGNGHDLSFLSGLVVAEQVGAEYPFPQNQKAYQDFKMLKRLMGF